VEVQENGEARIQNRSYDLDASLDSFWNANAASPFPNVAVEVNEQIKQYEAAVAEVNKLNMVDPDDENGTLLESKTKGLGQIVSNIPELQEKKRVIDMHTNVATCLMKHIKDRQIDKYFSFEESTITRSYQDKKELLNLISPDSKGTPEDKLRLFLIYFMSTKSIPPQELEQYEDALTKSGADLGPLKYLKKTKAFNESILATLNSAPASSSSRGAGLMSMITGTITQSYQGYEAFDRVTNLFSASVSALLPRSKDLYVTRVVDALMEMKNSLPVEETYLYFDPKVQAKGGNIPRKNTPFKEAIVFVVGGGNYVEYQNLLDYAKKQPSKRIIYGSTELLTPHEFLSQLTDLSKKSNN